MIFFAISIGSASQRAHTGEAEEVQRAAQRTNTLDRCRSSLPYYTTSYLNETVKRCLIMPGMKDMSCKGFCGKDTPYCKCTNHCQAFGDCCYDFISECGQSMANVNRTSFYKSYSCQKVWIEGSEKYFFAIDTCPDSWKLNITVMEKCERPDKKRLDVSEFIPVTMEIGGFRENFRNIFCATCNTNSNLIESWNSSFECKNDIALHSMVDSGGLNFSNLLQYLLDKCYIEVRPKYPYVACTPSVDRCNTSLQSFLPNYSDLSKSCSSYFSLVTYSFPVSQTKCSSINYKNSHCAFCNGISLDRLSCYSWKRGGGAEGYLPPSFSLLLDFSHTDLRIRHDQRVFADIKCGKGELLSQGTCQKVLCASGSVLYHGQCVRLANRETQPQPTGSSLLTVVVSLAASDDFKRTPSGFIWIRIRDSLGLPMDSKVLEQETFMHATGGNFVHVSYSVFMLNSNFPFFTKFESLRRFCFFPIMVGSFDVATCEYFQLNNYNPNETFECSQHGVLQVYKLEETDFHYSHELERYLVYLNGSNRMYQPETLLIHFNLSETTISLCEYEGDNIILDCDQIKLTKNEYVEYAENKTIRLLNTGLLLNSSQYTHFGNGIKVCEEWLLRAQKSIMKSALSSDYTLQLLSLIGGLLSVVGLAFNIVTTCLFKSLQTLPGKNLMNLSTVLFLAQLLQLTAMGGRVRGQQFCVCIAVVMHYLWLASFCWMSAIAFHTWRMFRKIVIRSRDEGVRTYRLYLTICYCLPLIAILPCLIIQLLGIPIYAGNNLCWISNPIALMAAFIAPISITVLGNMVLFPKAMVALTRFSKDSQVARTRKNDICHALIYLKVCTLMGFSWIFGFLALLTNVIHFWYLFVCLGTLQGLTIALAFNANRKVLNLYRTCCLDTKNEDQHNFTNKQRTKKNDTSKCTTLATSANTFKLSSVG